jgi:hypothetical protein
MDCIVDIRVTDTDTKSYYHRDTTKVLITQDKEKKRKYFEPCLEQRRHFTPFVSSTDGLLGHEAATFAKRLAQQNWQPHGNVSICNYVGTCEG